MYIVHTSLSIPSEVYATHPEKHAFQHSSLSSYFPQPKKCVCGKEQANTHVQAFESEIGRIGLLHKTAVPADRQTTLVFFNVLCAHTGWCGNGEEHFGSLCTLIYSFFFYLARQRYCNI